MKICAISIYPVKSLGSVSLSAAEVTRRGLAGDRRWMIVNANGRFVTRREVPALARIALNYTADGGYRLAAPEGEAALPSAIAEGEPAQVTVWRDSVAALVVENDASRLVSEIAGRPLRLAYMPDVSQRAVDPVFARAGEIVSFADGFPLLVVTQASLAALNAALERPVPIERFRPNIVLAGEEIAPWAEDGWAGIGIGPVHLRMTKPCSRCIVVTQDHRTGERPDGDAPIAALRRLGRVGREGALFGMNAVPETLGRIAVADEVRAAG